MIVYCCRHRGPDGDLVPVRLDTCPCYVASNGLGYAALPPDVAEAIERTGTRRVVTEDGITIEGPEA